MIIDKGYDIFLEVGKVIFGLEIDMRIEIEILIGEIRGFGKWDLE